jgi:hypothetical protein
VLTGGLYWLACLILAVRVVRAIPRLQRLQPPQPPQWPKLSLIIPACNEADSLEDAVRSRLADGYPNLEVILVDDRSTDGTGQIIDQLAAADPRVRAFHVRALPAGWLGKVHALQRGVEIATGEWLLFTDADVHLVPGTLRRCIAYVLQRNLDHLAVIPELWRGTFLLDVLLATFVRVMCLAGRLWAVENPRAPVAMGVGAFNLVRRAAFERTPGFAWLKFEVVDDIGLGQMLKQAGARGVGVNGRGLVGLYWYRSLGGLARGMEKAAFAGLGHSGLTRMLVQSLVFLALDVAPFVGLLPLGIPRLLYVGVIGSGIALLAQAIPWCWISGRLLPALFVPFGALFALAVTLRSAWLAVKRGGLIWRGTLYPADELRQGTRVKLL